MSGQLALTSQVPAWLERRDPRLRVLCALVLALVAVSLSSLPALGLALVLTLLLALVVRLPWRALAKRLLAFEGFMLVLMLFLPFTVPGEPLVQGLGLTISQEGLERALVIGLRANTVVLGMLTLLGTLEPEHLGHALGRLRVPDKLVHLFLMTVRYLFVLHDEYQKLRTAMRARAFVPGSNRHTWRSYGWLVGMLLVRSLERSRRVLAAMRCRGFQGRFYLVTPKRWRGPDSLLLMLFVVLFSAPIALELMPGLLLEIPK